MRQCYVEKKFRADSIMLIETANSIIDEYQADGYVLTIRQLYYQLVARDVIPNTLQDYKRVASLFNDARLAGLMDWDAIEDRTREFIRRSSWESGASILRSAAHGFHMDMWSEQSMRPFVIVEKEALVGVFERVCNDLDVPVLAARGYPSVSVVREFVERDMVPAMENDQRVMILHFGDHDPSGIDMSRDLQDRIDLFLDPWGLRNYSFKRCALNMDQIEEQSPPENPAKTTDSRFASYRRRYGTSSWELDALTPAYLAGLVRDNVENVIEWNAWREREDKIEETKERITKMATDFEEN